MFKIILKIIKLIKCKINCCYQSSCSMNENKEEEEPPKYEKGSIIRRKSI